MPFVFEYDKAYLDYVSKMNHNDLWSIIQEFKDNDELVTMLHKELSQRNYSEAVELYEYEAYILNEEDRPLELQLAYLSVMSEDEGFRTELLEQTDELSVDRLALSILLPSIGSIKGIIEYAQDKMRAYSEIVVGIIKSILGKSLLGTTSEENLDKILKIISEQENMNCVQVYNLVKDELEEDENLFFIRRCPLLNEFVQRSVLVTQPEREFIESLL